VLFACQEELHRADSAVGLDLRQRFLSLYSPRPKRLAEPIVMERLRLAVAYREAFGLDSLLSLQGGSIQRLVQRCHQSFEERLNQRKGVAAQLCKLC
jgi:hypothetical protein